MRGEGEPQTIVRPTALVLKCQLSRGFGGLLGILVNPGCESRSLASSMCELDSNQGIVTVRKVNDTFQRLYLRVSPESLIRVKRFSHVDYVH